MEQPTAEEIQEWITLYLAQILVVEPDEIGVATPFEDLGIDSTTAAGLSGDLGEWLRVEFDVDLAFHLRNIEAVTGYAVSLLAEQASSA